MRARDPLRSWWLVALTLGALTNAAGCVGSTGRAGEPERVWGRPGIADGRLSKPRAIAIDSEDHLYIVDMTGRIQVFNREGQFVRGWRTPLIDDGKPCGLSFDRHGRLLVADTHYFRVLFYTPQGELLDELTIGGQSGEGPGQFSFVTDAVQDSQGNFYVAEYGLLDRVQKFSPEGEFLMQWGSQGVGPGQFMRPQGLAVDEQDRLWVVDACNHRIQIFDATGDEPRLVKIWGEHGTAPGQLRYPYDLVLTDDGFVYISEFGNHRVQKFTRDGRSLGVWGEGGSGPGQLRQPWGLVRDSRGRVHVLDTYNHRVQRFRL